MNKETFFIMLQDFVKIGEKNKKTVDTSEKP